MRMSFYRRIAALLLTAISFNTVAPVINTAGAAPPTAPDVKLAEVEELLKPLCFDKENLRVSPTTTDAQSGEPVYHLHILVSESEDAEPKVFDCAYFGIGPVRATDYPELAEVAGKPACDTAPVQDDVDRIIRLKKDSDYALGLQACEVKGTKILSEACVTELNCNMTRGAITALTGGTLRLGAYLYDKIKDQTVDPGDSCYSLRRSSCVEEVVLGVLKGLWANVEGLGLLAKLVWDGVKWTGGKIVSWFSSPDVQEANDKAADAALVAGTQSESAIESFKKDPRGFVKNFMGDLMTRLLDFLRDNFREQFLSWKCATCDAIVNGVCTIVGYLGSEVLLALLTGGAINVLAKSGKASKIAGAVAKVGTLAEKSKVVRFLAKSGGLVGRAVIYVPGKILTAVARLPGVKQYLHLTEHAFMYGYLGRKGYVGWKAAESLRFADDVAKLAKARQSLMKIHPDLPWEKMPKLEAEETLKTLQALEGRPQAAIDEFKTALKNIFKNGGPCK